MAFHERLSITRAILKKVVKFNGTDKSWSNILLGVKNEGVVTYNTVEVKPTPLGVDKARKIMPQFYTTHDVQTYIIENKLHGNLQKILFEFLCDEHDGDGSQPKARTYQEMADYLTMKTSKKLSNAYDPTTKSFDNIVGALRGQGLVENVSSSSSLGGSGGNKNKADQQVRATSKCFIATEKEEKDGQNDINGRDHDGHRRSTGYGATKTTTTTTTTNCKTKAAPASAAPVTMTKPDVAISLLDTDEEDEIDCLFQTISNGSGSSTGVGSGGGGDDAISPDVIVKHQKENMKSVLDREYATIDQSVVYNVQQKMKTPSLESMMSNSPMLTVSGAEAEEDGEDHSQNHIEV
jgi:hypothetical protein